MKIIITENQYKLIKEDFSQESTKKILFKIWNNELKNTGNVEFDGTIGKYVDYKPSFHAQLEQWFTEFMGGWGKMVEVSNKLLDKTFDTNNYDFSGGYDFRFYVDEIEEWEEDHYLIVRCRVNGDGKVTLMYDDYETLLLSHVEENEEIWWEVESEIRSLIEDILYQEVTKKTGIFIDVQQFLIES